MIDEIELVIDADSKSRPHRSTGASERCRERKGDTAERVSGRRHLELRETMLELKQLPFDFLVPIGFVADDNPDTHGFSLQGNRNGWLIQPILCKSHTTYSDGYIQCVRLVCVERPLLIKRMIALIEELNVRVSRGWSRWHLQFR